MDQIVYDEIGLLHLVAAFVSLGAGTFVLLTPKGTQRHKAAGYVYLVSMGLVLVTALLIYRLFGGFGAFHLIAIVGFVYLTLGMVPVWRRSKNWLRRHLYFMYWSVIGLYAAFAAEILVRVPQSPFWGMVGIATAAIAIGGGIYYSKKKTVWSKLRRVHS